MIDVQFTAPVAAVDALLPAHLAWLETQTAAGRFLAWGPKAPRTGGLIVARAQTREMLEALVAQDPYVTGGVARSTVIGWNPRFAVPALAGLVP